MSEQELLMDNMLNYLQHFAIKIISKGKKSDSNVKKLQFFAKDDKITNV